MHHRIRDDFHKQFENENKQENEDENKQEDEDEKFDNYFQQQLLTNEHLQQTLLSVIANIALLCNYERFDNENIALQYLSNMKIFNTRNMNAIIVSAINCTIEYLFSFLFILYFVCVF